MTTIYPEVDHRVSGPLAAQSESVTPPTVHVETRIANTFGPRARQVVEQAAHSKQAFKVRLYI